MSSFSAPMKLQVITIQLRKKLNMTLVKMCEAEFRVINKLLKVHYVGTFPQHKLLSCAGCVVVEFLLIHNLIRSILEDGKRSIMAL